MTLPNPPEYESPYADQFLKNIAELRHLYKNLVREGKEDLARGLLGPCIEFFMNYWEEKQRKEHAEEEHFEKMREWNERLVKQEIEDTENYDW